MFKVTKTAKCIGVLWCTAYFAHACGLFIKTICVYYVDMGPILRAICVEIQIIINIWLIHKAILIVHS